MSDHEPDVEYVPICIVCWKHVDYDDDSRTWQHVIPADEHRWRAVKDRDGYYVHQADTHAYPGADKWSEERCALRADVGCNAKSDPPAEAGGSRAARGPEPTD